MGNKLILKPQFREALEVKLNNDNNFFAIEDVLNVTQLVYDNVKYTVTLDLEEGYSISKLYLNGEEVKIRDFTEETSTNAPIIINYELFSHIIGFAHFSIRITTPENSITLYSEYLSVCIKENIKNRTIDDMIKYVYDNQSLFLSRDEHSTILSDEMDDMYSDFWSRVLLLQEIVNEYESDYAYFMANSRHRLDRKETIDGIEKLQYIDSKTINFIVQHPEYLKQEKTGIEYGRKKYLPSKVMMERDAISYDIYENGIIVSFLQYVLDEIYNLKNDISKYLDITNFPGSNIRDYIFSPRLLYENARSILAGYLKKLNELDNRVKYLFNSYKRLFNFDEAPVFSQPVMTSIFSNIPEYNRIYICINRWLYGRGYNLIKERNMFNYSCLSEIYEKYVLLKLILHIKDMGYNLVESKQVDYPMRGDSRFGQKNILNTYIYRKTDEELILYYEPVIYNSDRSDINNITLYRNTSISFDGATGNYYTPDYLIKYSKNGKTNYLISDAKYSNIRKTQTTHSIETAFKYLISISSIDNSKILGLVLFYGLTLGGPNETVSFFDTNIADASPIEPIIDIMPLSESISPENQASNLRNMVLKIINSVG